MAHNAVAYRCFLPDLTGFSTLLLHRIRGHFSSIFQTLNLNKEYTKAKNFDGRKRSGKQLYDVPVTETVNFGFIVNVFVIRNDFGRPISVILHDFVFFLYSCEK